MARGKVPERKTSTAPVTDGIMGQYRRGGIAVSLKTRVTAALGRLRQPQVRLLILSALCLYFLIGVLHAYWTTSSYGLRGDEISSVTWASEPVGRLIKDVLSDVHPPTYFLLLRPIALVTPHLIFCARLLSLSAACLCAFFWWKFGGSPARVTGFRP